MDTLEAEEKEGLKPGELVQIILKREVGSEVSSPSV